MLLVYNYGRKVRYDSKIILNQFHKIILNVYINISKGASSMDTEPINLYTTYSNIHLSCNQVSGDCGLGPPSAVILKS